MGTAPPGGEPRYPHVHVDVPRVRAELVSLELFELGAQGIEERDHSTMDGPSEGAPLTLVASFADERQARQVVRRLGRRFRATLRFVVGDTWRDAWKAGFRPTLVSPRIVVHPSWEPCTPRHGEVALTLDPGRAFGTGTHESTRLVLREIDRRLRPGDTVLDVGCGSGILGIAALLLGAHQVRAVDVDPDAVAVTRENARLNRVGSRLRASDTDVGRLRGRYNLVLANIEAGTLVALAPMLIARVAARGLLVLSGVLRDQREEVAQAFSRTRPVAVTAAGDWVAIVRRVGRP